MSVPLAEKIIALCKEGLEAWKTFISTRQEAYERKKDKQQVKAIDTAEDYILLTKELLPSLDQNKFKKELRRLEKYEKRFFDYNQ